MFSAFFYDDDGTSYLAGAAQRTPLNTSYGNELSSERLNGDSYLGYFLVSDGGVTLSSIQDPTLNANNANSPYNVSESLGMASFLLGGLAFARRKKV